MGLYQMGCTNGRLRSQFFGKAVPKNFANLLGVTAISRQCADAIGIIPELLEQNVFITGEVSHLWAKWDQS